MAREGLHITLMPIKGLTGKDLLPRRGLLLQCPPTDDFTVVYAHTHTEYDAMAGQFSRRMTRQLATVSFTTLVVDWGLYVLDDDAPTVEEYTEYLRKLVNSGDPFRLVAQHKTPPVLTGGRSLTMTQPEVDLPMTLRNFQVTEKAGEGDARYFNVEFHEYRYPKTTTKGKKRQGGKYTSWPQHAYLYGNGRAVDAGGEKITGTGHPLTLAMLARHYYRDATLAQNVAQANDLGSWGANDRLTKHKKFKGLKDDKRVKLKVPAPPIIDYITGTIRSGGTIF